jgi:hypothetical protein
MKRTRTLVVTLVAVVMSGSGAVQAASVVGYWDYAGQAGGYRAYDFKVHNGTSEDVDFLNVFFQMPAGQVMLADGEAFQTSSSTDNSFFYADGLWASGLVDRTGYDSGAKTATGLYGAFERDIISPGADATVARLTIDGGLSIGNVDVGGSFGSSLYGAPAYAHPEDQEDRPFGMALGGDANLDGIVDVSDLGILAGNWRTSAGRREADFNADGYVDVSDLGILAGNWGRTADELAPYEPAARIPEPLTMATFGLAGLAVWRKARKRLAL